MRSIPLLFVLATAAVAAENRLPDGTEFPTWEKPPQWSRTLYVDGSSPRASDDGPGTLDRPFRTINRAAQVLQPGERVVIAAGTYREVVRPARGGTDPARMIGYEAAEGATVIVKGSVEVKGGWKPSAGWNLDVKPGTPKPAVWELTLDSAWFGGYNPFGMVNVLMDRYWLDTKKLDMQPYFRRRGMIFVDGKPLQQVDPYVDLGDGPAGPASAYSDAPAPDLFREFGGNAGRFWIEHNGLTVHIRLTGDSDPTRHLVEAVTREQVFAPSARGLGYIRVKGITFQHAASGFPVPQRGLVSTNRGNHWVIEDNTIEWANSVALDIGGEDWNASQDGTVGHHIVRRNIVRYAGICGIAGFGTRNLLLERNLIEHTGWQNAERMWESSGVKLHVTVNLLARENVIRHNRAASGMWLDYENVNCRVTGNLFADIVSVSGGLHHEASHRQNQVDGNVFVDVRRTSDNAGGAGLFLQGSDRTLVSRNLFVRCDAGVRIVTESARIVGGRGGTARFNQLRGNLFIAPARAAIEFSNPFNEAEGNLYASMPEAYLRITSEPQELLDLEAWRELHHWDMNGSLLEAQFELDPATLRMRLQVPPGVQAPPLPDLSGVPQ